MHIDIVPDSFMERLALSTNRVPSPWIMSQASMLIARTLMAASKLGVFEALSEGPLSAAEVAEKCKIIPEGAETLLDALESLGYIKSLTSGKFTGSASVQKWLAPSSKDSIHDNMLWRYEEWNLLGHLEKYLSSGKPAARPENELDSAFWNAYQRGMAALAGLIGDEVAARVPLKRSVRSLIDIGGGHGLISAAFCKKYPGLRATVFDMPQAVQAGKKIIQDTAYSRAITFKEGNALTDDFGTGYDCALLFNVVHHFPKDAVASVLKKVRESLVQGGIIAIGEPIHIKTKKKNQFAMFLQLLFQLVSGSPFLTEPQIRGWLAEAGFERISFKQLRKAPGNFIATAYRINS